MGKLMFVLEMSIILLMILSFFGTLYYINFHNKMIHNVDLIFNLVKDDEKFQSSYEMIGPDDYISVPNLWSISMTQLWNLHLFISLCSFFFGVSLSVLMFWRFEKNEKSS